MNKLSIRNLYIKTYECLYPSNDIPKFHHVVLHRMADVANCGEPTTLVKCCDEISKIRTKNKYPGVTWTLGEFTPPCVGGTSLKKIWGVKSE